MDSFTHSLQLAIEWLVRLQSLFVNAQTKLNQSICLLLLRNERILFNSTFFSVLCDWLNTNNERGTRICWQPLTWIAEAGKILTPDRSIRGMKFFFLDLQFNFFSLSVISREQWTVLIEIFPVDLISSGKRIRDSRGQARPVILAFVKLEVNRHVNGKEEMESLHFLYHPNKDHSSVCCSSLFFLELLSWKPLFFYCWTKGNVEEEIRLDVIQVDCQVGFFQRRFLSS